MDESLNGANGSSPSGVESLLAAYVERLNAGDAIDIEAIKADHPEVAEELIDQLRLLQGLEQGAASSPPLGTLGDYTLRRQIGRGGMGVVYEAWQNSMDRQVALKVLPVGIAADTKACARFMREAQTAGKLNHQNIVGVRSTGIEEGTPWYSMEYVEGETLAQILTRIKDADESLETPFGKKGELAFYSNLAAAFADVADGLQHAHSKGVIHRDIKPSNLILDGEGKLRILDFGLARLEGQESLTLSGDLMGTVLYMSPEQAMAKRVPLDHRTDVYSLGATLYEALTGQPPFRGKDQHDTLSQIIVRDPRPPRQLNARVPVDLETVVLKCLRKDSADRYGTAEALAQDLRRFVRGNPVEAHPESAWEKGARHLWRKRKLLAACAILLLLALAGLAVTNVLVAHEREAALRERDARTRELYVASMPRARDYWEAGNFAYFVPLLERHVPGPDEQDDLRRWEWFYLNGLRDQELLKLQGHTSDVISIDWSADGRLLASGSYDGTVRLWDVAEGRTIRSLQQGSPVLSVRWGGSSGSVLSAGDDGAVKVWRGDTGEEVNSFRLDVKDRRLWCVAWSEDRRLVAAEDGQGTLGIWQVGSGEKVRQLTICEPSVPDFEVRSMAWSPGDRWLAVGFREHELGPVSVWDTETWAQVKRLSGHERPTLCLAWHPDGRWLASGCFRQDIRIWSTDTWTDSSTLLGHCGYVWSVAWSPDGSTLASVSADGTTKIWQPSTATDSFVTIRGHIGGVWDVSWNAESDRIATGSADGTIRIWDAFREQDALTLPARGKVAWSRNGLYFAALNASSHGIDVFDAGTFARLATIEGFPEGGCFSHDFDNGDGRLLATISKYGWLQIWDWRRNREEARIPTGSERGRSVAWSPTDCWIATGGQGGAWIWDPLTGKCVRYLPAADIIGSVAWSPDGSYFAAVSFGQVVAVWDTAEWTEIASRRLHPPPAWDTDGQYSIAWSPDSTLLAAGSARGTITVWNPVTGELMLEPWTGHTSVVRSVAWSPDSRRIATGSNDRSVKIWDPVTGEDLLELDGFRGNVLAVDWSPDGRRLAAGDTHTVKIWDAPGYEPEDATE